MNWKQIEDKLRETRGSIHGFSSGGGLRVLCLKDCDGELVAYGEGPQVEDAFEYLTRDLELGRVPYKEFYGVISPHYLTGTTELSSDLDAHLRWGHKFRVRVDPQTGKFLAESRTSEDAGPPREVSNEVLNSGISQQYTDPRGYVYSMRPSQFPSGEPCVTSQCIEEPDTGPVNPYGSEDPWYRIISNSRSQTVIRQGFGDSILGTIQVLFPTFPDDHPVAWL